MEVFGKKVSRLRKEISEVPRTLVLGASSDQSLWMEAASALDMLRLRDQTYEMTQCNGLVRQRT